MFLFSKSKDKFKGYTDKSWLYFFLTQPQPNDQQAFVKFGKTERTISERLASYTSFDMANIYGIQVSDRELGARETVIKRVFKVCKMSENVDIWPHVGDEYLKGNLDLMLKVFLYFSSISFDKVQTYHSRSHILKPSRIVSWLDDLNSIEQYKIVMLTPKKIHKMVPEIDDILDIESHNSDKEETEDMARESTTVEDTEKSSSDSEEESGKHLCERCGKAYKGKRGLSIHLKTCKGVKNLVCEYCNNNFSSVYCLSIHITRCSKSQKYLKEKEEKYKDEIEFLKQKLEEKENTKEENKIVENDKNINISIIKLELEISSKDKQIELLTKHLNDYKEQVRSLLEQNSKLVSKILDSK
jgi:hypothetical protein